MSKPISISFGKSKTKPVPTVTQKPPRPPAGKSAFRADPDEEPDEIPPAHESVVGFSSNGGVILSAPLRGAQERVIENKGNQDWRTRGRPATESSPQTPTQQENGSTTDGVASSRSIVDGKAVKSKNSTSGSKTHVSTSPPTISQSTEDQAALSALIDGHKRTGPTVTVVQPTSTNSRFTSRAQNQDETLGYLADVASRPDPATLDEYAAMPVSEFGMALVRGMGRKRRANGEVIEIQDPNVPEDDKKDKAKPSRDPNAGYLGIGAKMVRIEGAGGAGAGAEDGLGAWGKADIRRSRQGKGEGLYTPVMLRDRATGEVISEKELEERKKVAAEKRDGSGTTSGKGKGEDDWRDRRDRNLLKGSRDGDHTTNGHTDSSRDRRKLIENGDESSSSSRRRSRSRDRRGERNEDGYRVRDRDRERDRDRDRDGDRERRKERHRDRDGKSDRDRDRDRDRRGSERRDRD